MRPSRSLSWPPRNILFFGGSSRTRTYDLVVNSHLLYLLSYTPNIWCSRIFMIYPIYSWFFQIVAVWFFISFHHLKNQEFLSFWFFGADEQNRTAISSVASWYTNHCATSAKGWIDTRLVYHYYLITVVSTVPTTLLIFSSGKSLFTIYLFRNKV